MKSWKEVPHLFANGKFEVKLPKHWKFDNTNLTIYTLGEIFREDELSKCTLIARPISDMSDEQIKEFNSDLGIDFTLKEIIGWTGTEHTANTFLYLLSIGVYPFDQDKPKDVIWRYENA